MKKIIFATGNEDKMKEIRKILADPSLEILSLKDAGIHACGYHLIKHYLQKTGKNIVEATLLPAKEILNATEDFWNE